MLTGPDLLSMPDIAAQLSATLGRRVRYVHLPGPLFGLVLRLSGASAWTAYGLVRQFVDVVRHGHDNVRALTDTVHTLTGEPSHTFADLAARHRQQLVGTTA